MKKTVYLLLVAGFMLMFAACSKDPVDYSAYNATHPKGNPLTSNSLPAGTFYVNGTLNGNPLSWQVNDADTTGFAEGAQSATANNAGKITGSLEAMITAHKGVKPQFAVTFKTYNTTADSVDTYFTNFVNTGAWNFAPKNDQDTPGVKEIVISYTDAAGNYYTSEGSQTGSNFNVLSVTPILPDGYWKPSLKINFTFSCKLYPADVTKPVLTFTNGEATIRLENLLQ